jgi:hypothetical protein
MLKQLTAIFLLTAFVAQTFTGSLIRLDYYTNTNAYAKNCINKAKPKMHCNGKCQMMKKMQEEEKKDQENTERKYENKINVLSSKSFFTIITPGISTEISMAYYSGNNKCTIKMPRTYFHPPTV